MLIAIGWFVIFGIAAYCVVVAAATLYGGLGWAGRVVGEFYFIAAIAAFFCWLCWYTFPFHISVAVGAGS
jgi:hypothetical protein